MEPSYEAWYLAASNYLNCVHGKYLRTEEDKKGCPKYLPLKFLSTEEEEESKADISTRIYPKSGELEKAKKELLRVCRIAEIRNCRERIESLRPTN